MWCIRFFLIVSGVFLISSGVGAEDVPVLGEDLGAYKRFVVYPHLARGLKAQKAGDREEALKQFKRAYELAPQSADVALYLARAYETYDLHDEARQVVMTQLAVTPTDPELLAFVRNLDMREPLAPDCLLPECRIARAEQALKQGKLDAVLSELEPIALAESPQGVVLRRNVLQQALQQGHLELASEQFTWLDQRQLLNPAEQQQWVWMLLQEEKVFEAIALYRRLGLKEPKLDLAIGFALAKQKGDQPLRDYLDANRPAFQTVEEEQEWLQLMAKAGVLKLENPVQFSVNGVVVRRSVLQQALQQGRLELASEQFKWLEQHQLLSPVEQQQWVWVLLQEEKGFEAAALYRRLGLKEPKLDLAIGFALAKQKGDQPLRDYLNANQPAFQTAEEEQEWLQLMARVNILTLETPLQFDVNRRLKSQLMLVKLQQQHRWSDVGTLLSTSPDLATPELNFEVALAKQNWPAVLENAREWVGHASSPLERLDIVSYRLLQVGRPELAGQMLMEYWPFKQADSGLQSRLAIRLAEILPLIVEQYPLPESFSQPLATPQEREQQAQLLAAARDCKSVRNVLGDLSAEYGVHSWTYLAQCYQKQYPGLAEYAYEQAVRLESTDQAKRALAYQAHENQHYQKALGLWREMDLSDADKDQLLSAVYSALEAGDLVQAAVWLHQYAKSMYPLSAEYWRSLAKTQEGQEAVESLLRAIELEPQAQDYSQLAGYYNQQQRYPEAEEALLQATRMAEDDSELQRAYGYMLLQHGKTEAAGEWLGHLYQPDDLVLTQDLAFINQKLAHNKLAQGYAAQAQELLPVSQKRFEFQRMHEDLGRRWTFSVDGWTGTPGGSQGGARGGVIAGTLIPATGGNEADFQSFTHMELDYRLGEEPVRDGRILSMYGRVYSGGEGAHPFSTQDTLMGIGLRWKPLSEQTIFFAAEHVRGLDVQSGKRTDTMLRASASFLNDGVYSDDWQEEVKGWWARNLYLDSAYYTDIRQTSLQADYRQSYHHKIQRGQTLEPYGHIQGQRLIDDRGQAGFRTLLAGVGVRWNYWFGETQYDAWRHKMNVGIEYQRVLGYEADDEQRDYNKDIFRFIVGVRW